MTSKVTEIALQKPSNNTPVVKHQPIAPVAIGDELNKLGKVELKEPKLPSDPKEIAAIKLMVAMAYPNVEIDSITNLDLQTKYYPQYLNGTLQKKCEALRPKMKEVLETIKKEKRDPAEAANELLDKRLALQHEGYEKLSERQKDKLRDEAKLKFLKAIMPEKFVNATEREERRAIKEFTTTSEAFIYAFQTGKISTQEDVNAIFNDPHRIGELQYEWADAYFKEHPEQLEQMEKSVKNTDREGTKPLRRLFLAYQRGNLDKTLLKESGMSNLEELHHSGKYTELKYEYLKKHEAELNNFERRELKNLEELKLKNGGDLSGIKNTTGENNVDTSLTEQIIESDGIDIENDEIEILNKEDLQKLEKYGKQIKTRLNECETAEELKACIQDIRKQAQTDNEARILDMMMNHIMADLQEQGNSILTPEFYVNALDEIGVSPHMAVMTSTAGNAETQKAYSQVVAESKDMTNTQKAGYTVNVIPEYEVEAQAPATNTMTDTGIQEVHDVLPETYAKLDQTAAKETFEHAMNSNAVSDEQKAIIARDTIDTIQDADLKKFFQELSTKYNVDYSSVPAKSERTPATNNKSNDTSNNKVADTNFTEKEATALLNLQQNNNILEVVGNGIKETVDIILGKTPDNNIQNKFTPITSLNDAFIQLQSGAKLSDVFRQSNAETKKELVGAICTYGKTAIAQLIGTFGGQTIYNLAKTDAAKALIKKELERIAMSDSTQRAELAEIKKAEEKDSLKAKA